MKVAFGLDMNSGNGWDKFKRRFRELVGELYPIHMEQWVEEARPFLQQTVVAIGAVRGYRLPELPSGPAPSAPVPPVPIAPGSACPGTPPSAPPSHRPTVGKGSTGKPGGSGEEARANPVVWTIADAARAFRQRTLSPVELIQHCLTRVDATDGIVRAWAAVAAEEALARARQAERALGRGDDLGPLHGIPFGVKDNIFTEGLPTSGGSRLFQHYIPAQDAGVVTALKRAGAIVLGKTTTAEMALGDAPPTRNPWRPAHTPGGSSSGSAAAVAAGHVPFALGTQTGGSLNRPAGYCGLVAMKPTYGCLPLDGVFPVAWTLDHVGAMTKTAKDQALVLRSLVGNSGGRPYPLLRDLASPGQQCFKSLRGLRVGRPDRYFFKALHPAQRTAYEEALHVLRTEFGVVVTDVELPPSFEAAAAAHTIIMQCEVAAVHASALRERAPLMGPMLRARILCGHVTGAGDYIRAQQVRRGFSAHMYDVFEEVDLLATPTTPTPAPEGISSTGSSVFNAPFTLLGFPTIVFPTGFAAGTSLPLSMQLVARPLEEATLLTMAMAYEGVTDWHGQVPGETEAGMGGDDASRDDAREEVST